MKTSRTAGYSLSNYGGMIADSVRQGAYLRAMKHVIRPGAVVLDLGAGTGIISLLACKLGASRVYAIEPADAILVARELAAHNGVADRIHFIQDDSSRVELPERVDVVVTDLRGVLPLFQRHLPVLADVRERFLAPGGVIVGQQDELFASIVDASELYDSRTSVWLGGLEGIDMSPVARFVTNTPVKSYLRPEQLLAAPLRWATLDYHARTDFNVTGELNWTAERSGTAHGIAVWFDAYLAEGVSFSNAPSAPTTIYGQLFLPLTRPVSIESGDSVTALLEARLVGNDYVLLWNTLIQEGGNTPKIKAQYRQSSFLAVPLSSTNLRTRAADYTPALDAEGRSDAMILSLMDGWRSLGEIARQISLEFPGLFPTWQDAMHQVGVLSEQYSHG
jgi:protein arginine N-methyltransferase 1